MKIKNSCLIFLIVVELITCKNSKPNKITESSNSLVKYELVKDWPSLPSDIVLGNPTGIGIDTDENIFVFHRGNRIWPLLSPMPKSLIKSNTILMLDKRNGKILNSWGSHLFVMPHGLTVDSKNNIWVTDCGLQQVLKFSHDGKLLMTLGQAMIPGNDETHFNRPTDVAIAKDGSFYVTDGYRNSRVMKFSPTGHFLFQWGIKGSKHGEFIIPHSVALDENGNVYVADRENSRIQIFDSVGHYLQEWENNNMAKTYSVFYDKTNKQLVVADYSTNWLIIPNGSNLSVLDLTGNIRAQFGRIGNYDGPICRYHDVVVDKEGNIYTADILNNKIQKFKKMSN